MIKGGFILQPRCIEDSDVAHMAPAVRELWAYLLREVNFIDSPKLKRGQCFTRFDDVREALHWKIGWRKMTYSRKQIEGAYESLRKVGMVDTTKVTHGMIVTVCKYAYYQTLKNYEGYTEGVSEDTTKGMRRASTGDNNQKEGIKKDKESNIPNTENDNLIFNGEKTIVFQMAKIYGTSWADYSKLLNGNAAKLSEEIFTNWKKFVSVILENEPYQELFNTKFVNPTDFGTLMKDGFSEELWEPVIKKLLSTGVEPKHNLYFRIPDFIKYAEKDIKNAATKKHTGANKGDGRTVEHDKF